MLERLRTWLARTVAERGIGPRSWQIRAWAQLLSETDDLAEQMGYLKAIVALDPDLDWAQAALTRVWFRWRRES
jgi:hypothetical protein